jgi:hypothetical protein
MGFRSLDAELLGNVVFVEVVGEFAFVLRRVGGRVNR